MDPAPGAITPKLSSRLASSGLTEASGMAVDSVSSPVYAMTRSYCSATCFSHEERRTSWAFAPPSTAWTRSETPCLRLRLLPLCD